jgi:hypothetical protein
MGGEFGPTADEEQTDDNSAMKPWYRRPGESVRAYNAFCAYRELGPGRSLAEATRRCVAAERPAIHVSGVAEKGSFKRSKSGQIGVWCRKFGWVERCREWDAYQAAVYKNCLRKDLEQMAESHADQARLALEVLMIPITALAKSIEQHKFDVAKMSIGQVSGLALKLAKLVPALHRCERTALGLELVDPKKDQARRFRSKDAYGPPPRSSQPDLSVRLRSKH